MDKAIAALAKPRRNSEVGTAEEQIRRHCEWCKKKKDFSCAATMCRKCYADWGQMPYEAVENKKEVEGNGR